MLFSGIKSHFTRYTISFLLSLALVTPLYAGKNGFSSDSGEEAPTAQTRPSPSQSLSAEHLASHQDHTNFLMQALSQARENVMISSYSISPARLFGEGIDEAIIDASSRGVNIYVYYQNLPWLSKDDYQRLQKLIGHCARFEANENHSKCVAQDKTKVAIGSYNWLSETDERSLNRSWVVSGLLARGLIDDVWQGIRFYESLKHDNVTGIRGFFKDRDAFSTGAYQFHSGEFLYTLRTPEAHGLLFEDEVLAKAQKEILISSPFIRLEKLKQTLSKLRIKQLEKRKVRIHLFTLHNPCSRAPRREKDDIFDYLNSLSQKYLHFSYSIHGNLHAKTIIADDLLCEGSFNLLSAVNCIDHSANNFEMSVAIRGDTAAPFIAAFHNTLLAQHILSLDSLIFFQGREGRDLSPKRTAMERSTRTPLEGSKKMRIPEIKVFSGKSFNRRGFCALLEGEYIRDPKGRIAYFPSSEKARTIAQEVWMSE